MIYVYATLTGICVGAIFGWLGLLIPAPPTLAGILGILGITLGYMAVTSGL